MWSSRRFTSITLEFSLVSLKVQTTSSNHIGRSRSQIRNDQLSITEASNPVAMSNDQLLLRPSSWGFLFLTTVKLVSFFISSILASSYIMQYTTSESCIDIVETHTISCHCFRSILVTSAALQSFEFLFCTDHFLESPPVCKIDLRTNCEPYFNLFQAHLLCTGIITVRYS